MTTPVTVTLPQPRRRQSLRVRLKLAWTWSYGTTILDKATIGRFPRHMRLTVRCVGRRCPRPAKATGAGGDGVRHLLRSLEGHRYEVGDRLRITLTAPGFRSEVAELTFRYERLPRARMLRP
jgi:hypothetical protein